MSANGSKQKQILSYLDSMIEERQKYQFLFWLVDNADEDGYVKMSIANMATNSNYAIGTVNDAMHMSMEGKPTIVKQIHRFITGPVGFYIEIETKKSFYYYNKRGILIIGIKHKNERRGRYVIHF